VKVFWNNDLVGYLEEEGEWYSFTYEEGWNRPLSQSLPIRKEPYHEEAVRFFGNLLPEEGVRDEVARLLKIEVKKDFDFFKAAGHDLAGAIRFAEKKEQRTQLIPLKEENFKGRHPRLGQVLGGVLPKFSLAGAQTKIGVRVEGNNVFLPIGGPSTHILKMDGVNFPGVQNEIFCTNLAGVMGLDVPRVTPLLKGGNLFSLHERYDRAGLERIHQEDLLQALGPKYSDKYESRGGPELKVLYEKVMEASTSKLRDQERFVEWVLFNFLIRNGDAHAKNMSILYPGDACRFAPMYDLICTGVFRGKMDTHLAMTISGEQDFNKVHLKHFENLATGLGMKGSYVTTKLQKMANKILNHLGELDSRWSDYCRRYKLRNQTKSVCREIKKQAKRFV